MRRIGIRDLKGDLSALIGRVEPVGTSPGMAQLIEEGRVHWSGRRARLPEPIELRGHGPTAADLVIVDRGPR